MANLCSNIINVTYFDETEELKLKTSRLLHEELQENFSSLYPEYCNAEDCEDEYEIECYFEVGSKWVAPLQFFHHLCNKYNVDIIGVAYEFGGGYVESFELHNQLVEVEEHGQHVITFVDVDEDAEIETIEVLPNAQDDEILDKECPKIIEDDDFELNCKTILGDGETYY
jgi:hypothetical protein